MINIGVIGGGTYGQNHLGVFKDMESQGKVKLVAMADLNEELRNKHKADYGINVYDDWREMIEKEKLDGVTVATPDHLHLEIVMGVLDKRINCMVEKPLDVTVESCEKMIAKAQEKNLLLEVDFYKRFDPYHIEMRERFIEGGFGQIEYGYSWMEDQLWVPVKMLKSWQAPKASLNAIPNIVAADDVLKMSQ